MRKSSWFWEGGGSGRQVQSRDFMVGVKVRAGPKTSVCGMTPMPHGLGTTFRPCSVQQFAFALYYHFASHSMAEKARERYYSALI